MKKYEAAMTLKLTTARVERACDTCGSRIERGAEYFRESLGLLAKPPGLRLKGYCIGCGTAKSDSTEER